MELIVLSRSSTLINRTVLGPSIVDADTNVDAADGDAAGGGFNAIGAMAKCC